MVSQQGTNISSKHLVHCKPIMAIPWKANYSLVTTIAGPTVTKQHFRS